MTDENAGVDAAASDATDVTLEGADETAVVDETTADETPADETTPDETLPGLPFPGGQGTKRGPDWGKIAGFGVLPALAVVLALAAGYLFYVDYSARSGNTAAIGSTQAAKDGTVAILSYAPDKVEQQLNDARGLLTGDFANQYADLIKDVVIPGAKQKQISAVATVPAVGSVTADSKHAVVLLFVNQTVVVGTDAPTDTASTVKVTLDKAGDKWLISAFTPI